MMKKRIFAVLLIVALCLSLCSCDYLDEMRKERFDWGNEEKTILVSRSGVEYKLIPNEKSLVIEYNGGGYGYIADSEDIPLLLADLFGEHVYTDLDENFISFYADGDSEEMFFCRSDRYDEINKFINKKSSLKYGYSYRDDSGEKQFRELTKHERSAVSLSFDAGYKQVPRSAHNCEKSIEIDRFNEKGDLWILSYYIQLINGKYCLSVYDDSFVKVYTVPDEYVGTFMKITKEAFH